ncbi:MAG: hypothetical protein JSS39_18980 [Nitrospira sp.]|nr:hypothetical protein [Nitrospira sp.]
MTNITQCVFAKTPNDTHALTIQDVVSWVCALRDAGALDQSGDLHRSIATDDLPWPSAAMNFERSNGTVHARICSRRMLSLRNPPLQIPAACMPKSDEAD